MHVSAWTLALGLTRALHAAAYTPESTEATDRLATEALNTLIASVGDGSLSKALAAQGVSPPCDLGRAAVRREYSTLANEEKLAYTSAVPHGGAVQTGAGRGPRGQVAVRRLRGGARQPDDAHPQHGLLPGVAPLLHLELRDGAARRVRLRRRGAVLELGQVGAGPAALALHGRQRVLAGRQRRVAAAQLHAGRRRRGVPDGRGRGPRRRLRRDGALRRHRGQPLGRRHLVQLAQRAARALAGLPAPLHRARHLARAHARLRRRRPPARPAGRGHHRALPDRLPDAHRPARHRPLHLLGQPRRRSLHVPQRPHVLAPPQHGRPRVVDVAEPAARRARLPDRRHAHHAEQAAQRQCHHRRHHRHRHRHPGRRPHRRAQAPRQHRRWTVLLHLPMRPAQRAVGSRERERRVHPPPIAPFRARGAVIASFPARVSRSRCRLHRQGEAAGRPGLTMKDSEEPGVGPGPTHASTQAVRVGKRRQTNGLILVPDFPPSALSAWLAHTAINKPRSLQQPSSPPLMRPPMVWWCSWLSRQSNTLKVLGSNPSRIMNFLFAPFSHVAGYVMTSGRCALFCIPFWPRPAK